MKELKTKTLTVDEKRDLYEYLSSDSPEIIDKVEEIHEYIKELAQDFMRTEIWELNQKPELIGLIYQTVGIGLKWSLDYWLKFIEEAEKEAVERGSEEIKSEISSQITTY